MPYPILRFMKKKMGAVSAAYTHNERKKEIYKSNPDIDINRREDNYHLIIPKQTYLREVKRLIQSAGCRLRKDSTVMVETLITASPEFMNGLSPPEQREYFTTAISFIASKISTENIIAATVHMDEKTPHMHLSFCPITKDGRLSAKQLLGNQASLSRWQTEYHAAMSARWPELERGISAIETKRKHIPAWLFKAADRLDRQAAETEYALSQINAFNAKKQREKALDLLNKWLPEAANFSVKVKAVDGYIKQLEQAEKETQNRITKAKEEGKEAVREMHDDMQKTVDYKDGKIAEKDDEILAARRKAYEATDKLRRQADTIEHIVGRLPLEMRVRFREEQQKVFAMNAAKNKSNRERGHDR